MDRNFTMQASSRYDRDVVDQVLGIKCCYQLHACSYCQLHHRLADCKFALKENQEYYQQA